MTKARASLGFLAGCFVLLVACTFPGPETASQLPPCNCPNLVQVVESIEWVPGVTGGRADDLSLDDLLSVQYAFDVADPPAQVRRLLDVFKDRGLPVETFDHRGVPVEANDQITGFTTSGPGYRVRVTSRDRWLWVEVGLVDSTPDHRADEVLQPVVQAIGQRD